MKSSSKFLWGSCFALSALCLAGCDSDSSVNSEKLQCTSKADCGSQQICQDGECVAEPEPEVPKPNCGNLTCKDDQTCINKKCVNNSLLCGGVLCNSEEACVDGQCLEKSSLCDGVKCGQDQVCVDLVCKNVGDCGGLACSDEEVCLYNVCHKAGDCGGLTCAEGEVCYEGECRLSGKCGGIKCNDDELCLDGVCKLEGDCGGIACAENEYCLNDYCYERLKCGDVICEPGETCNADGVCEKGEYCIVDAHTAMWCGNDCCDDDSFCGSRTHCCNYDNACGNDCCGEGEVCENEMCHRQCEFERCELEDGSEVCCASGEICASNQCFVIPKTECIDNYMCDNGQYCDTVSKECLPLPKGETCEAKPTGGAVQPTLVWYWGNGDLVPEAYPTYTQVMSAPMVADVDGDGKTEVIFNSWAGGTYVGGGILRIVDGATGKTLYSSNASPFTDGGSQVAVGDIIPDNPGLEIATCTRNGSGPFKMAVYNNKAQLIWVSSTGSYNECGQSGPGIADFDGDGNPEVFSRYNIYNGKTGETIARVSCGDSAQWHQECDYPLAADVDGDTLPELVGGNVVYKIDVAGKSMSQLWKRTDQLDGYPAIADLDLNGTPEVVTVRPGNNTLMAFNALDGTNHWSAPADVNVGIQNDGGGGPPNIANVDDDANPEITLAGAYAYVVFEHDGSRKWYRRTKDYSSRKTGSTIFDFNGDGKAEAVYADECYLRVYDGQTGDTKYCQFNPNGTHWEYPVIADVNNDDHAEIVISANTLINGSSYCNVDAKTGLDDCVSQIIAEGGHKVSISGVRVFSSPDRDWVNTRKIYNQHAYSITNVSDNGTIPKKQRNNWTTQGLNNFRLNVQPGASYLPDLQIKDVSSPLNCDVSTPLYFVVKNAGWATALAGVKINIWLLATTGSPQLLGTVQTTKDLRAGEFESLKFDVINDSGYFQTRELALTFGDNAPIECRSDNNDVSYTMSCAIY